MDSQVTFMAMPFNRPDLMSVYDQHVKPAVARTGYELRLSGDNPKTGSIDDRMRVEIRRARFLVCELTENNAGAYWEAGFAEGPGMDLEHDCIRTDGREGTERVCPRQAALSEPGSGSAAYRISTPASAARAHQARTATAGSWAHQRTSASTRGSPRSTSRSAAASARMPTP